MSKVKEKFVKVGLYGNFKKGRTHSKHLKFNGDGISATSSDKFVLYNGNGGVPKLYDIKDNGHNLVLSIYQVSESSLLSLITLFKLVLKDIKTDKGLVSVPFYNSQDLDLVFTERGMNNGE